MNDMHFDDIKSTFDRYVIPNYPRNSVAFVRGEGSYIWDSEGNRYIDLMPGWGTTTVGYCHPRVVKALQEQAEKLIHVDNTFYTIPQGLAAQAISEHSFGGQCFFCNSGAEAVEAAIKLARLHGDKRDRHDIVTMENSFHGRSLATITATGQNKYHKGYVPLVPGFEYVPFNDIDAVKDAVNDDTCAVMLEPVQGEGGICVADEQYLREVRHLCDEEGILLVLDEVQTGMGRTGEWFGYQNYGIEPDIMTLAKALGGGTAVGAMVARPEVAESLAPGTHASTFGGNPLACAAILGTVEAIEEENLLRTCHERAATITEWMESLQEKYSIIDETRQLGLMVGVELDVPAKGVFEYALENGVRCNCTHKTVVRLLPCMNIPEKVLCEGLDVVEEGIRKAENSEL